MLAAEVEALLKATGKGKAGIRDRALIMVLWRSQLCISEALALRPSDIGEDRITVRHGKGDKARVVAMSAQAKAAIDLWVTERAKLEPKRGTPLFCLFTKGKEGQKIDDSAIRKAFKRWGAKAGIEKRVHPHGLRHTGASMLVERGADLNSISAQLGHSRLATTERYLHEINPDERVRKLNALL